MKGAYWDSDTIRYRQRGWPVLPSQANFILVTCPNGKGREAYLGLKAAEAGC